MKTITEYDDCYEFAGLDGTILRVAKDDEMVSELLSDAIVVDGRPSLIRAKRDALLAACDWTVLSDSPLSTDAKAAWLTYRQALRDVPEQSVFPVSIEWPEEPTNA